MKYFFSVLSIFIIFLVGCQSNNPNKAKAKQLLKKIDAISTEHRKSGKLNEVMTVAKRFSENKNNFPNSRIQLKQDAEFLKNHFENEIEKNNEIKEKLNLLLTLNLIQSEADCIDYAIELLEKSSEKIRLSISDSDLVVDENIKDLETLESKSQNIKSKIEKIDKEEKVLEEENNVKCSRK